MSLNEHDFRDMARVIRWGGKNWMHRLIEHYPWLSGPAAFDVEKMLVESGYLESDRRRYGGLIK